MEPSPGRTGQSHVAEIGQEVQLHREDQGENDRQPEMGDVDAGETDLICLASISMSARVVSDAVAALLPSKAVGTEQFTKVNFPDVGIASLCITVSKRTRLLSRPRAGRTSSVMSVVPYRHLPNEDAKSACCAAIKPL